MPAPLPDASVVIPTRDRWPLAARAVRCALGQRGVDAEVVLVDNGSRTPRPAGLRADRLRVLRLQSDCGVAIARNAGIEAARGRWIGLLDDDDVWAPMRLRTLIDAATASNAEFVYSDALVVDESLSPLLHQPGPPPGAAAVALSRRNAVPGGGSGMVAAAGLLRRCGGFDESFSYLADWELWWRLAREGRGAHVAEPLVAYVLHAGSWALAGEPELWAELDRMRRKHPEMRVDSGEYAEHVAYRLHLARKRRAAARRYAGVALRHRRLRAALRAGRALLGRRAATGLGLERRPPPAPGWLASCPP